MHGSRFKVRVQFRSRLKHTFHISDITEVIEEAARTLVLPRFARLAAHEVEAKGGDPEDLVTIADREVEAYLIKAFAAITPSVAVLGEESTYEQSDLINLISSDQPLWIIDPVDGTKNFAGGHDGFGIMVAYVVAGHAQASWVVLPARRETYVAESGSGAFLNGQRIRVPAHGVEGGLAGPVLARYMPDGVGDRVKHTLAQYARLDPSSGCAAIEYTDTLNGRHDFVVYYRLLPWDHAAPALLLTEAGGQVVHASGRLYSARSESQLTIVARSQEVGERLQSWLPSDRP